MAREDEIDMIVMSFSVAPVGRPEANRLFNKGSLIGPAKKGVQKMK